MMETHRQRSYASMGVSVTAGRRNEIVAGLLVPLVVVAGLVLLGLAGDQPTACIAFMAVVPLISAMFTGVALTAIVAVVAFGAALVLAVVTYGESVPHAVPVLLGVIVVAAVAVVASQRRFGTPRRESPGTAHAPGGSAAQPTNPESMVDAATGTDALTGLPTRTGVSRTLSWVDAVDARVVAFIDCDGLAAINDRYGRQVGDELLFAVAGRTRYALPSTDIVARWDGDEFLVVIAATSATATLELVADKVNRNPIRTDSGLVPATISLGAAAWPKGSELADAIARARRALHLAKSQGPGRLVLDASIADLEES